MLEARVRLWERLSPNGVAPSLISSIHMNLQWILNTRIGDSLASADYGLPDMSTLVKGLPKSELAFARAVEEAIRRYEPRLANIDVSVAIDHDAEELRAVSVSFSIDAELVLPRGYQRADLSGRVTIDSAFEMG